MRRTSSAARCATRCSGATPHDWDLATDALPERRPALFPGAVYENRFGTVAVRRDGERVRDHDVPTDHDYADLRRPHRVEFGDVARGRPRPARLHGERDGLGCDAGAGSRPTRPALVDPFGGVADSRPGSAGRRRPGRAVRGGRAPDDSRGPPRRRRSASTIEPATLAAIGAHAAARRAPLRGADRGRARAAARGAERPSVGLRLMADDRAPRGTSRRSSPRQRGIAQNKIPGEDLWDHTLRTVDARRSNRPVVRLAALLHDIGKPATARRRPLLRPRDRRRRAGRGSSSTGSTRRASTTERVVHLVRNHMFSYEPSWSDAAVRRFIAQIGPDALDELFALREADNVGSGVAARRRRARPSCARGSRPSSRRGRSLDRSALAIDGDDLIAELGLAAGPGARPDPRRAARAGHRATRRSTTGRPCCSSPRRARTSPWPSDR